MIVLLFAGIAGAQASKVSKAQGQKSGPPFLGNLIRHDLLLWRQLGARFFGEQTFVTPSAGRRNIHTKFGSQTSTTPESD